MNNEQGLRYANGGHQAMFDLEYILCSGDRQGGSGHPLTEREIKRCWLEHALGLKGVEFFHVDDEFFRGYTNALFPLEKECGIVGTIAAMMLNLPLTRARLGEIPTRRCYSYTQPV